jgi:hypothetical protein
VGTVALGSIAAIFYSFSQVSSAFAQCIPYLYHSSVQKTKENVIKLNEETVNKDLILRERLALQRTTLANQTTILSSLFVPQ